MTNKIVLSDVYKKDLRVIAFLIIFGGVTVLSDIFLKTGYMSVLFGAVANYVVYRVQQELNKEGYTQALKK
jgi:hypothetical protein